MALSQSNLAALQQAGQATYNASKLIAEAMHLQAQELVAHVASQPFHSDSEQAFAQFKALAALSHDLQSLETQMRALYARAAELASPLMDVLESPRRLVAHASSNVTAVDAIVKPARERKAGARNHPVTASATPRVLTANDTRLLDYLRQALRRDQWTGLTGSAMATGSGLPLGSVGISLSKILGAKLVRRGKRGMYQLP